MSPEHEGRDADKRIRFLGDEDFRDAIIEGLRRKQPEVDILTAVEVGTLGRPDPAVLAHALEHGRIVLTHDKRTMPQHRGAFLLTLAPGQHSPGVFVVPQRMATGPAIEELLLIWEASEPGEWRDRVTYLPL